MALAVCLLFDPQGELTLRRIWSQLEARGIRSLLSHTHGNHHPHVSYAVLMDWEIDAVQAALGALPDGGPVQLNCHGLVTFPRGRACIAPSVTAETMRRQETVVASLRRTGAIIHRHYEPGQWLPHCSLAPRATGPDLPIVAKAVTDVLPLTLVASRAALVDSSTGETWLLPTIP